MAGLLILRTTLRQLVSKPVIWLLALGLCLVYYGLELFMPLGLTSDVAHRSTAHYGMAYLAGAATQLVALDPSLKMRWAHRELTPAASVVTDVAALTLSAVLVGAFILVPAEALRLWQLAEFRSGTALACLMLAWVHVAGIAAVVPLRSLIRDKLTGAATIAFATALLPALVVGPSPHASALIHWIDPTRLLRASFDGAPLTVADWVMGGLPALGWAVLAVALESSPNPRRHRTAATQLHGSASPGVPTETPPS